MIVVYGIPGSRSLRVVWTLEELGLEYDYRALDMAAGEGRSEGHLARHPDGKVPVLEDGELVLFESLAICRYLVERYGASSGLLPTSPESRALVDQWLSFTISELEQPLWTQGKHKFALPPEWRVPALLPTAAWEFQRALGVLQRCYSGDGWLVGEQFSLADLFVAQTLNWGAKFKNRLTPELDAYRQRCLDRPAQVRAEQREASALE